MGFFWFRKDPSGYLAAEHVGGALQIFAIQLILGIEPLQ